MSSVKKYLAYFCLLGFVLLFSYCNNPGSNNLIITNKTNDNIYVDFSKTKSPIDTVVKILKDNSFRYQIFSFDNYSENSNNTDVERELSKINIFKVINKDTLYLPLAIYSKVEKLDIGTDNDLGSYRNDFYLNISDVLFEQK